MFNKGLLLVILIVTVLLVLAAVELLPGTSYFPVVEYTAPGNIRFVMMRHGEPDQSSCEKSARIIENAVRSSCAECQPARRCVRGLNAEQRKILSREPLATPSLRTQDGRLTMTVAAADPETALSVCRLAAEQTAPRTADKRLLCFPALASR